MQPPGSMPPGQACYLMTCRRRMQPISMWGAALPSRAGARSIWRGSPILCSAMRSQELWAASSERAPISRHPGDLNSHRAVARCEHSMRTKNNAQIRGQWHGASDGARRAVLPSHAASRARRLDRELQGGQREGQAVHCCSPNLSGQHRLKESRQEEGNELSVLQAPVTASLC
jgi:hypothetical protein